MQIEVTTRHGSISEDIREHLISKSEKLLTYFERLTSIQVTVDLDNSHAKNVEILLDAEHKHDFVANGTDDDVMVAFDRAFHKMEQQVKKYKGRIQDHRRDRPTGELVSPEEITDADQEGQTDQEESERRE